MEPGAELALLGELRRRELHNRLVEWWREAKKHPLVTSIQLLGLGFFGAMLGFLIVMVILSPYQFFNLQPGRDYHVGALSTALVDSGQEPPGL